MKKIAMIGVWIGMFLFPVTSFSQGIEAGDSMFSLYGGFGSATQKSGMEIDGKNISWGNLGAELGLSYLYFPSDYLGLGMDMRYAGFRGSENVEDVPGWWHWHTLESKFNMDTFHVMGAGRINLNPYANVRVYIPFGAGIVFSSAEMEYWWDDRVMDKVDRSDSSLGWYAGLGIEFDLTDRLAWGLEGRYNSFRYDYRPLVDHVGGKALKDDMEHNYVSLVISIHFK